MVRDLQDMSEDSLEARMLAGALVLEALRFWCAHQRFWSNRKPSVMLRHLRGRDSSLAAKVESFYASSSPAHVIAFADAVLELVGGRLYEFSTDPERVSEPVHEPESESESEPVHEPGSELVPESEPG
jgi:hypothetical protein